MSGKDSILHLCNGGTSVVLDCSAKDFPTIVYWGADLGKNVSDKTLKNLVVATQGLFYLKSSQSFAPFHF